MDLNKINMWADRITVFSYCALIYFLPISNALIETFSTIIITTFFFRRGFLTRHFVSNTLKKNFSAWWQVVKPVPTPLNKVLCLLLAVNLISVIFSQYPALSIKGFVFKLFQGVILFLAFVETMRTKRILKIFILIFLISATLIVSNGIIQFYGNSGIIHGHLLQEGRIPSSFHHPNDFSGYLIIVVMLLMSFLMGLGDPHVRPSLLSSKRANTKFLVMVWFVILFAVSLACLGYTFSRGGWIGFLLACGLVGVLRPRMIYFPLLMGVLFFNLFFPQLSVVRNVTFVSDNVLYQQQKDMMPSIKGATSAQSIKQLAEFRQEAIQAQSFVKKEKQSIHPFMNKFSVLKERFSGGMGRSGFWEEAFNVIKDYPFFGSGLNTYSQVAPKYRITWGGYPHNCYLQMAAETGFIGLGVFLWMLVILFQNGLLAHKRMQDSFLKIVLLGFLVGLFGFMCHSFVDTNFYSVKLGNLMWICMGAIILIPGLDRSESPAEK